MAKQYFNGNLTLTVDETPITFYVKSMKYDSKVDKKDASDTGTPTNAKEWIWSTHKDETASFEMLIQDTEDGDSYLDYIKEGITYTEAILNFTGKTISCSLTFDSVNINAPYDDLIKVSASATLTS